MSLSYQRKCKGIRVTNCGVRVHCLDLGGEDLSSPAGKLMMQVFADAAEFERDYLIDRTW